MMPSTCPRRTRLHSEALTPRQIVAELDKHVVGQRKAKRAVAIALRNRMRRQKLPPELAEEVAPKNILMIGPTGVGKTEIARRLARARAVAVHQGRGVEVHRGRLRRPRRRVDGPRPRRARRRHGARGARRRGAREGARRPPRSGCSICCCRRRRRAPDYDEPAAVEPRAGAAHAREAARAAARRTARRSAGRDRRAREERSRRSRSSRGSIGRGSRTSTSRTCCRALFQGRTKKRRLHGPRSARGARARRRSRS